MNLIFTGSIHRRCFTLTRLFVRSGLFNTVFLLFAIPLLGVSTAFGQGLDTRITLSMNDETLEGLFKKIQEKTTLSIVYTNVDKYGRISFPAAERSVKEILDLVLPAMSLAYHFKDNRVLVYEVNNTMKDTGENESTLKLSNPSMREKAKTTAVTGTVTKITGGEPMAGVNIIVKGTTHGTTTDIEGKFSIDAADQDVLVFSFIGYKTYETQVGSRSVIDVVLEEEIETLKEVMVNAGYWKVKDQEKTGNISRLSFAEVEDQSVSNPLAAMQGKMTGIFIQQTTGVPGGGFKVQIRGRNSIRREGNDPLYIIDGVPFTSASLITDAGVNIISDGSPLNNINPNDIESIEVLKDADATSIYGSRGANGVVLISTKKGAKGKGKVDINVYTGVGKVSKMMDLLNTAQWMEMRNEAFRNDNATPQSWDHDMIGTWDSTRYTDWQKKLIGGTAHITNAQVSVSGGNDNTTFLISGGFYRHGMVFPGDFRDQKVSGHSSFNHTSENKKFSLSFLSSYVADNNRLIDTDLTNVAISLAPVAPPVINVDGNLNWANGTWPDKNPFAYLRQTFKAVTKNHINSVNISYEITPRLRIKTNLGYTSMTTKGTSIVPKSAIDPVYTDARGYATFSDNSIETYIIEPIAEYERKIGYSQLSFLAGATLQQSINASQSLFGQGYSTDALIENIHAASAIQILNANYVQYKYNAAFGRIHYHWKEKYFINLTGRRDGSSRFGPGKRFANFGAVGAAWIFSNEGFIQNNLSFLSFGKLRASYGTTGNDQIGDYAYLDTYSPTGYPYQGGTALYPTNLVNPDFAWEVNRKLEAGLEFGFLQDRILFSTSWYRNRSSNQLIGYSLPQITGFNTIQFNLPATVENKGLEFEFSSINIKTHQVQWSTSFNFTVPRNKLVKYPDIEASSNASRYTIGKSLFIQNLLHYTGVDTQSGIYTFEDVNNDERTTVAADKLFTKEITQDFYGGLQNTVSFKGFELDIFFQFVKQTGWNYLTSFYNQPGLLWNNQPTLVMDRWQKPGDLTDIQKFSQAYNETYEAYSNSASSGDNSIGDASFIRLKNISLAYRLPAKWNNKLRLQRCKIYVQGQNVVTFTNYIGMDPETQSSRYLPPLRVITGGIHVTF